MWLYSSLSNVVALALTLRAFCTDARVAVACRTAHDLTVLVDGIGDVGATAAVVREGLALADLTLAFALAAGSLGRSVEELLEALPSVTILEVDRLLRPFRCLTCEVVEVDVVEGVVVILAVGHVVLVEVDLL
eukprot:3411204-Heterocapsa_arctica.AAC.1